MPDGWRFIAERITGDGEPGETLHDDLPLQGVQVTDVLSGPPRLSGHIDPVFQRLVADDGRPLLEEDGTIIYAEQAGSIRGAGIYTTGSFDGPRWSLDCAGMAAYPVGMGYEGEISFVGADPLDVVRHAWTHIQEGLDSNLGLQVDQSTTTPITVGTDEEPYELNPWSTDDLGTVIDQLARTTPFDYREYHRWNQTRTEVEHFLEFGYPKLGVRRRGLRFVLGENMHTIPTVTGPPAGRANHVRFLGSGEGRDMVRAESRVSDGRLRRMVTIEDKSVDAHEIARRLAREELTRRQAGPAPSTVTVQDTTTTPLGSWQVGDEIRVQGELDWISVDLWMRVLSITVTPDNPEVIAMSLSRADLT